MAGEAIEHALARMGAALDRIEAAAVRAAPHDDALRDRHERLRAAVGQSLRQLDELLAGREP